MKGYIRVWKKREGRWLSMEEYRALYPQHQRRVLSYDEWMLAQARTRRELEWRSRNPVMERAVAAYQGIKGGSYYPSYPAGFSGAPTGSTAVLLDAENEKVAYIGAIPEAGEVSKTISRTGTVTTGGTFDNRLEGVDLTDGDPDGALIDTNSNASLVIADADDNKTFITTLTATATVTRNQLFAIVIVAPAGVSANFISYADEFLASAYVDHETSGTWAKQSGSVNCPAAGLVWSGDVCYPIDGFWPLGTTSAGGSLVNTRTVGTGTDPDELGNIVQFPWPCTVTGFWLFSDRDGDVEVLLYDNAGNAIAGMAVTLDLNVRVSANANLDKRQFDSTYDLAANTNIRVVARPTTATTIAMYDYDVPAAYVMDAFEVGQLMHRTQRVNGGSFTQTATERVFIGIQARRWDDGAGSGGGGVIGRSLIAGAA